MSSQKQWHRRRRAEKGQEARERDAYLARKPPRWRLIAYWLWKREGRKWR